MMTLAIKDSATHTNRQNSKQLTAIPVVLPEPSIGIRTGNTCFANEKIVSLQSGKSESG